MKAHWHGKTEEDLKNCPTFLDPESMRNILVNIGNSKELEKNYQSLPNNSYLAIVKNGEVENLKTSGFHEGFFRSFQVLANVSKMISDDKPKEEILEFIGKFYKEFI